MFKQKTAYEMRISDWSSDVCTSDLAKRLVDAHCRHMRGAWQSFGEHGEADVGDDRQADQPMEPYGHLRIARTGGRSRAQCDCVSGHIRSETRRVGQEGVGTLRFRWSPYH